MLFVNQSAAVILTSLAIVEALGVAKHRWLYLHGAASGNDIWHVIQRHNFHSSTAMQKLASCCLKMASKSIDDIVRFDL